MDNVLRTKFPATSFRDAFELQAEPKEDNTRHIPRSGFSLPPWISLREPSQSAWPKFAGGNPNKRLSRVTNPGLVRGDKGRGFQVLPSAPGPQGSPLHPGTPRRVRAETPREQSWSLPKVISDPIYWLPFIGGWVGKQQPEQVCCSLALRAPTVQPVLLSPRDAPGCSGKEHKPSIVSVGAHKPSSGAELRVTTDRSPQGMFLGTSISEQRSKFLMGPGSAARASRTWCSGVMWLQWKMTPSFPKIISLVLMAQRIQQGLCWGAECRPCCRGQTQHGIN